MSERERSGKVTQGERMMAQVLRWAPWLAFLLCALPAPIYFLTKYFSSMPEAALNFLFALTSLAVGSVIGFAVMLFLLYYRRHCAQRVRDRIASDGVTATEIPWLISELTPSERQALKEIDAKNPMLADAYRETLASRITASRVVANAKRELLLVELRLNRAGYIAGEDTTSIGEQIRAEHERVAQYMTD